MELRPYQKEAVQKTLAHFRTSRETACLVLPTGAGKSVVIAELARNAVGRVLVLAHVKELCSQNYEKYVALTGAHGDDEKKGSAGLYSAGLGRRESSSKVIFGSVQSVVQNLRDFSDAFSLLIIDECHRVSGQEVTQYGAVLAHLLKQNAKLCVLGLTATPYRLGLGWTYQFHASGVARTAEPRPFTHCVFEVSLRHMVEQKYLTEPRVFDAPIAEYNYGALKNSRDFDADLKVAAEVNELLVTHARVTESICAQVKRIAEEQGRRGVMLFAATVAHAREIAGYLGTEETALILGETDNDERDRLLLKFKNQELRYLVNVSVLTTGFDAPHVDFIALLRPTESVSLFQQIAGRGLRLYPGKTDCLIIDYSGNGFDLFSPEIGERKPTADSTLVTVPCPECGFDNQFWGQTDESGHITEHFGRRCHGTLERTERELDGPAHLRRERCSYRFRFKECEKCGAENDIAARTCTNCQSAITDPDEQLKRALGLKDALVLRVCGMEFQVQGSRLVIRYHDEDGATLTEKFDFENLAQRRVFNRTFARRIASGRKPLELEKPEHALTLKAHLPIPDFVVGRRRKISGSKATYLRVEARLFDYQGPFRIADKS